MKFKNNHYQHNLKTKLRLIIITSQAPVVVVFHNNKVILLVGFEVIMEEEFYKFNTKKLNQKLIIMFLIS